MQYQQGSLIGITFEQSLHFLAVTFAKYAPQDNEFLGEATPSL